MLDFRNLIHDAATGIDGKSYDVGRVAFILAFGLWSIAFLVLLTLQLISFFHRGEQFQLASFAVACEDMMLGAAAVHIGGGANLWMKQGTEPPAVEVNVGSAPPDADHDRS